MAPSCLARLSLTAAALATMSARAQKEMAGHLGEIMLLELRNEHLLHFCMLVVGASNLGRNLARHK